MWGVPLHVAIIIVCSYTGIGIANRPAPPMVLWPVESEFLRYEVDGFAVYIGTHRPVSGYAYTNWGGGYPGVLWSWQHMASNRDLEAEEEEYGPTRNSHHYLTRGNPLTGFGHTGFHARQWQIIGAMGADTMYVSRIVRDEHKISMQMEVDALVRAVSATGEAQLEFVHEALSIRFARDEAFNRAMATVEVSEGTATYTEFHLLFTRDEINDIIQAWPGLNLNLRTWDGVNAAQAVSFGFPYLSGTLYGMLLDDFGVAWRPYVHEHTDFGRILAEVIGFVIEE